MDQAFALHVKVVANVKQKFNEDTLIMIGFSTGDEQFDTNKSIIQKSILELYPEYDFVIAKSLFKNKYKFWNWVTIIIDVILAICITIFSFILIDIYTNDNYISFDGLCVWTSILLFTLVFNILRKTYVSRKKDKLKQLYYIQDCVKGQYKFFINSNRKWGLIRNHDLKIVIPALYDKMVWKNLDKFIIASKNGASIIIDTNNQLCI